MDTLERRRYESFQRITEFRAQFAADFPADSLGAELLATIAAVADELSRQDTAKSHNLGLSQRNRTFKSAAREALMEDLQAMSRTARALSGTVRGIENQFLLPRKFNEGSLLNEARTFAVAAEPLAAEFIRFGMSPEFLADLRTDIAAFESAIAGRNAAAATVLQSNTSIDEAIGRGIEAVKQLDVYVRNRFRDNPGLLTAWTRVSHVGKAYRTRTASTETAQAAATTV